MPEIERKKVGDVEVYIPNIEEGIDKRELYQKGVTDGKFYQIGLEIAHHSGRGGLGVIGGDLRPTSDVLLAELTRGITDGGARAVNLGTGKGLSCGISVGAVCYGAELLNADAMAYVTASHQTCEWNGLKVDILKDKTPADKKLDRLMALYRSLFPGRPVRCSADELLARLQDAVVGRDVSAEMEAVYEDYVVSLSAPINPGEDKVVAIDPMFGVYCNSARNAFERLGYLVETVHNQKDGRFPAGSPDPHDARKLALLGAQVRRSKALFGVAFDGDGDRVGFLDEDGVLIKEDAIAALIAKRLIGKAREAGIEKPKVVYELKCSTLVPDAICEAGGVPIMEMTGREPIKPRMKKEGAILGVEISAHYYLGRQFFCVDTCDDALADALLFAEMVQQAGSVTKALKNLPASDYYNSDELRATCDSSFSKQIVSHLKAKYAKHKDYELDLRDGVRLNREPKPCKKCGGDHPRPQAWAQVRASSHEPKITIVIEGREKEDYSKINEDLVQGILGAVSDDMKPEARQQIEKVAEKVRSLPGRGVKAFHKA